MDIFIFIIGLACLLAGFVWGHMAFKNPTKFHIAPAILLGLVAFPLSIALAQAAREKAIYQSKWRYEVSIIKYKDHYNPLKGSNKFVFTTDSDLRCEVDMAMFVNSEKGNSLKMMVHTFRGSDHCTRVLQTWN